MYVSIKHEGIVQNSVLEVISFDLAHTYMADAGRDDFDCAGMYGTVRVSLAPGSSGSADGNTHVWVE